MKFVSAKAPAALHAGMTDQEAIDQIRHLYPRLGAALNNVMDRFQALVDYVAINELEDLPDKTIQVPSCPHCGTPLKLTQ